MSHGKLTAGACAAVFVIAVIVVLQNITTVKDRLAEHVAAPDKPAQAAGEAAGETVVSIVSLPPPAADPKIPADFPHWAFPGPQLKTIPGSKAAFSDVQKFDRTAAVDWFTTEHPAMPPVVKGRLPVYACGYCHLPEGAGRPENAALAGLPYAYFRQQVLDMRSGARALADPHFGPGANMMLTVKQISDADIDQAAKYYSSLTFKKHTKVVETVDIPHVITNSFVYVFGQAGPRETLGDRIVEGADDFERFEERDPNTTFTAYVPVGSIARGAALAKGDGGDRPACETCHSAGLKGGAIGPPLASRPLTYLFRQMYSFQTGVRNGAGAALMKPVVSKLSQKDMIDLAAYLGSLEP